MSDELFSVSGQVVLISGASRGIGKALAIGFAERGAQVLITGRDVETLERTAEEVSTEPIRVRPYVCDISDVDAVRRMVSTVRDEFERIDTLINVAGVNLRKKVETFSPEEFDFIQNINLRGTFLLSQEVGQHMIARRGGNIINIDSLNTDKPLSGIVPYAISKAGVSMMTRGMAMEWGEHGVRVNAIAPGFILTDLTRKIWADEKLQNWGMANTPLKRLGLGEDLVGAAVFLASKAATYMTGQVLYVDGGLSAGRMWPLEI